MEGQLEGLNEAIEEAEALLQGDEEDELTENARRRLGAETEEGLYAQREFTARVRYKKSSLDTRNKAFARRIRSFGGANKKLSTGTEEARRQQEAQERRQAEEARRQQESPKEKPGVNKKPKKKPGVNKKPKKKPGVNKKPKKKPGVKPKKPGVSKKPVNKTVKPEKRKQISNRTVEEDDESEQEQEEEENDEEEQRPNDHLGLKPVTINKIGDDTIEEHRFVENGRNYQYRISRQDC